MCQNNCNSCTPSNNCNTCNNTCGCKIEVSANCVKYEGENTICLGINKNDRLETSIQKIDSAYCSLLESFNNFNPVDGIDGKEIISIEVDSDNPDNLLFTYSDNTTISTPYPKDKEIITNAFTGTAEWSNDPAPVNLQDIVIPANTLVNTGDYIRLTYVLDIDITSGTVTVENDLNNGLFFITSTTTPANYLKVTMEISYKGSNQIFSEISSHTVTTGGDVLDNKGGVQESITFDPTVSNTIGVNAGNSSTGDIRLVNYKIEKLKI